MDTIATTFVCAEFWYFTITNNEWCCFGGEQYTWYAMQQVDLPYSQYNIYISLIVAVYHFMEFNLSSPIWAIRFVIHVDIVIADQLTRIRCDTVIPWYSVALWCAYTTQSLLNSFNEIQLQMFSSLRQFLGFDHALG